MPWQRLWLSKENWDEPNWMDFSANKKDSSGPNTNSDRKRVRNELCWNCIAMNFQAFSPSLLSLIVRLVLWIRYFLFTIFSLLHWFWLTVKREKIETLPKVNLGRQNWNGLELWPQNCKLFFSLIIRMVNFLLVLVWPRRPTPSRLDPWVDVMRLQKGKCDDSPSNFRPLMDKPRTIWLQPPPLLVSSLS